MKPMLAISLGDPAGIGPEIVASCLKSTIKTSDIVIFGHLPSLKRACQLTGTKVELVSTDSPMRLPEGKVAVVNKGSGSDPIDKPGAAAAEAQFYALEAATSEVIDGKCDALVTAPVSKMYIADLSPGFTGHTEYLATRCGLSRDDVTMLFASKKLTVGLVATHVPMKLVHKTITTRYYTRTLNHMVSLLKGLAPKKIPSIAVAAFNPHAGEDGLLGSEEKTLLEPLCRSMQKRNDVQISGPIPADTIFRDAFSGKYDGVIAAYHDQAMIPLKLDGFGKTVNITMGLPFIRTSPDHGVAYDIAHTGKADATGMLSAIKIATALARL